MTNNWDDEFASFDIDLISSPTPAAEESVADDSPVDILEVAPTEPIAPADPIQPIDSTEDADRSECHYHI